MGSPIQAFKEMLSKNQRMKLYCHVAIKVFVVNSKAAPKNLPGGDFSIFST